MIKNSLKNFGKNLLFVFIPMGIVYLFLLIAVFSAIGMIFNATSAALNDTMSLVGSAVEQSQADVTDFLTYAFGQIDWHGNLFTTIKTVLQTRWLSTTIKGFFDTLNQTTEGFDEQLNAIVASFKSSLVVAIAVAAVTAVVGVVCANYATRFAVRTKLKKRNFKQFVIAYVLMPLFQTALLFVALLLLATIKLYSFIAFAALLLLMGTVSMCSSYLVYRNGKTVPIKEVMTAKNVFTHYATLCIITAIDLALALLLWAISPLFSVLLMLPLTIYSANVADVNTDLFVASLVAQKGETEQTAEQTQS